MKKEDQHKAGIRLKDADEFLESARNNLEQDRFKASLDHSVDSTIAANDAFTIHFIGEVASKDHFEAVKLHKIAGTKISENKASNLSSLLEERHRKTYRSVSVTSNLANECLKKAERFVDWVRNKISPL
ncbi:MAG: HEPN domain-containing protein [Nanoarchaeota archaeon]|nr:HEPN domain-containing protein [Nanoarchaeota archaeon]